MEDDYRLDSLQCVPRLRGMIWAAGSGRFWLGKLQRIVELCPLWNGVGRGR